MQFVHAILIAVSIAVALIGVVAVFSLASVAPVWLQARSSGVELSLLQLFGIKLRGLDPLTMVEALVTLNKAGVTADMSSLEAHVLAGGNLQAVVAASVAADKAGLGIKLDRICAIDLAGRDVVSAVEASVNPKVLFCPPARNEMVSGVARDGIRLGAKVRVTVRANVERLVGGAGEATIIARVGEGIVAAIGKVDSHKEILENPILISKYILERGLDAGTAFEIVSVDVGDVDIVDNLGARLAEAQAHSDKQVAQARAEMRRVMAVARENEMGALVREMTAQLTANQASLPLALSEACHSGKMWLSPRPVIAIWGAHRWDASTGGPPAR